MQLSEIQQQPQNEEHKCQVEAQTFIGNSIDNLKSMTQKIHECKSQIKLVLDIKPCKLKIERDLDIECVNTKLYLSRNLKNPKYDKLIAQFARDLFVLVSYERNSTDIISITQKRDKYKMKLRYRVEKKLVFALEQEDRIIIDNKVFLDIKFKRHIQVIDTDDEIVGGLSLKENTLMLGHSTYGQFSIWHWDKIIYSQLIKVRLSPGMNEQNIYLTHFQKSKYPQNNHDEIFLVSQYSNLYKLPISDCINVDDKVLVYHLKMQRLVDYRQIEKERVLILTTKKAVIIDLTTLQLIQQFSNLTLNQPSLALISNFDLLRSPIMITQGKPGTGLDLKDVMDYGMKGQLTENKGFKLVGQLFFSTDGGLTHLLATLDSHNYFVSLKVQ